MLGDSNNEPPSTDSNRYDGEIEDTDFLKAQPTRKRVKTYSSTRKRARADRRGFAIFCTHRSRHTLALYTCRKGSVNREYRTTTDHRCLSLSRSRLDKGLPLQTRQEDFMQPIEQPTLEQLAKRKSNLERKQRQRARERSRSVQSYGRSSRKASRGKDKRGRHRLAERKDMDACSVKPALVWMPARLKRLWKLPGKWPAHSVFLGSVVNLTLFLQKWPKI
jgi:hypothetical protein